VSDVLNRSAVPDEIVARIPPLVDLDAHVVEPPDTWSARLPARFQERGPKVEHHPAGTPKLSGTSYIEEPGTEGPDVAWWRFEDQLISVKRTIAAAGYPADEVELKSVSYDDMRPGCWQPAARLADMDLNGVEAQLCFPNLPRFCGQLFLWAKDRDLGLACIEAYNDWMIDEWCGSSGGRLLPLTLVPLWDAQLAADHIRRNAARGVRAVAFSELPTYLDLPSIYTGYWDPFFEACQETGTVIAMHIGSGTKTPKASPDAPDAVPATIIFGNSVAGLVDLLFSGVLHRYPDLKVLYAEAQIGWIPYVLERADDVWETHEGWMHTRALVPEPPSTYYADHVFGCFFRDNHGIESIHAVGINNVTYETDYPHTDTTWPKTAEYVEKVLANVPDEIVHKVLRGNALNMLSLGEDLQVVR